ncbi:hypothetical protein [Salinirarus marinus]|uniref:hypothetical protein n=1 Tax=Salinirarus marinus TaxID=3068310 RepID=UPI003C6BFA0E
MKVVVLAAGESARTRPATPARPVAGDRSVLARVPDARRIAVDDVVARDRGVSL